MAGIEDTLTMAGDASWHRTAQVPELRKITTQHPDGTESYRIVPVTHSQKFEGRPDNFYIELEALIKDIENQYPATRGYYGRRTPVSSHVSDIDVDKTVVDPTHSTTYQSAFPEMTQATKKSERTLLASSFPEYAKKTPLRDEHPFLSRLVDTEPGTFYPKKTVLSEGRTGPITPLDKLRASGRHFARQLNIWRNRSGVDVKPTITPPPENIYTRIRRDIDVDDIAPSPSPSQHFSFSQIRGVILDPDATPAQRKSAMGSLTSDQQAAILREVRQRDQMTAGVFGPEHTENVRIRIEQRKKAIDDGAEPDPYRAELEGGYERQRAIASAQGAIATAQRAGVYGAKQYLFGDDIPDRPRDGRRYDVGDRVGAGSGRFATTEDDSARPPTGTPPTGTPPTGTPPTGTPPTGTPPTGTPPTGTPPTGTPPTGTPPTGTPPTGTPPTGTPPTGTPPTGTPPTGTPPTGTPPTGTPPTGTPPTGTPPTGTPPTGTPPTGTPPTGTPPTGTPPTGTPPTGTPPTGTPPTGTPPTGTPPTGTPPTGTPPTGTPPTGTPPTGTPPTGTPPTRRPPRRRTVDLEQWQNREDKEEGIYPREVVRDTLKRRIVDLETGQEDIVVLDLSRLGISRFQERPARNRDIQSGNVNISTDQRGEVSHELDRETTEYHYDPSLVGEPAKEALTKVEPIADLEQWQSENPDSEKHPRVIVQEDLIRRTVDLETGQEDIVVLDAQRLKVGAFQDEPVQNKNIQSGNVTIRTDSSGRVSHSRTPSRRKQHKVSEVGNRVKHPYLSQSERRRGSRR